MNDFESGPPRASLVRLARHALTYQRDPLRFFAALHERYGETVIFPIPRAGRRASRPLIVTSERSLLRQALTDDRLRNSALALGGPRNSSQRRLRHSLFRMHGEEHRRHRRLIGEALGKRAVEATAGAMLHAIDARLGRWQPGERRDLPSEMKHIARDVAASVLFGIDALDEAAELGAQIEDWWSESFRIGPRVLRHPRFAATRRMLGKAERLEARVRAAIARKRGGPPGADLFARLIGASDEHGRLSEDELVGHAHMLFLAAHETTAYALTWTLVLLSLHPERATELADEIQAVLGGAPPGSDTLESCPRLHDVIRESQRLLPVVPFGARIAAAPLQLGSIDLPRGSRLLLPFHRLHWDAAHFAEPRRFRPERWQGPPPAPYTYLPFSAGPHMCIGVSFAQQTLSLVLARVLQRFRLRIVAGTRIDRRVTVTLAPRGPVPVELEAAGGAWRATSIRGDLLELVELGGSQPSSPVAAAAAD